jgi:hypothetical protein
MSPRQKPSRDRAGNTSQSSPLKGIKLKVTITGAGSGSLKRLAAEVGIALEEDGDQVSLVISASTPEDALAKLGILSRLLASRT